MSALEFRQEWREPRAGEDLFGPERATFADLSVLLDGASVTRHDGREGDGEASRGRTAVSGPLNGIAEWLVDNWLSVLWEAHTPFVKSSDNARIPSLVDVREGLVPSVSHASFADWFHRHTLGHGSSDLALPTITFLPEDKAVGVFVAPPLRGYRASIRFEDAWPKDPLWVPKDECAAILGGFVVEVLARAASIESSRPWSEWLSARFESAKADAGREDVRRRLMLGALVAENWDNVAMPLGAAATALTGILIDAEIVQSQADLKAVAKVVADADRTQCASGSRWRQVPSHPSDRMLVPFKRGYRLAKQARVALGLGAQPIDDLREVLDGFDVTLERFEGPRLFRSASLVGTQGRARVYVPTEPGVARKRFAVAAALGRLLAEGPAISGPFGCAHGLQSRWQKTRQANAFAAEFLLPSDVFSGEESIDRLSDEYGISRSAAERHKENWQNGGMA